MPNLIFGKQGDAEALAAIEAVQAANRRAKEEARNAATEIKAEFREQQKVAREVDRISKLNETSQERYNRKLREAQKLLKDRPQLLAKEQQRLRTELDATDKKASGLISRIGTKVLALGGSYLSVHAALRLITEEMQAQQQLIDKRTATQLTVGESRNLLLRNLDESKPAEIRAAQQGVMRIVRDTGVSEVAINQGMASAVSSTSGNVPLSLALVAMSARYLKDKPSEIGEFAGSLADMTRVTNTEDATTQLGLLRRVGQLSRITNPQQQAENIAPALIGTMPFGGDARTSGSLYAALTGGGADKQGRRTRTALIALAQQLDEFAGGGEAFQAGNLAQRVAMLQNNPALATQFLEKASFEKATTGPVRQLLTDATSKVARDYQDNLQKIPENAELKKIGERSLGIFEKFNELEPVAERNRTLTSTIEQVRTGGAQDKLNDAQLEQLRELDMATGGNVVGSKFSEWKRQYLGGGGLGTSYEEAIDALKERRDEVAKKEAMARAISTSLAEKPSPGVLEEVARKKGMTVEEVAAATEKAASSYKEKADELTRVQGLLTDAIVKLQESLERNTDATINNTQDAGITATGE